ASIVRADISYHMFRDFAENKGLFVPGATDIPVYNKDGHLVGRLDKAPMPDFSSVTIDAAMLRPGEHTLYSPGYVVTAK
ncbi:hypothetical protein OFC21_34680, partial [Escherichia coli]|nr:hypothetical protein [Escherichia coli]